MMESAGLVERHDDCGMLEVHIARIPSSSYAEISTPYVRSMGQNGCTFLLYSSLLVAKYIVCRGEMIFTPSPEMRRSCFSCA